MRTLGSYTDGVRKEAEIPGVGAAGNVFPGIMGHFCCSGIAREWEKGDERLRSDWARLAGVRNGVNMVLSAGK